MVLLSRIILICLLDCLAGYPKHYDVKRWRSRKIDRVYNTAAMTPLCYYFYLYRKSVPVDVRNVILRRAVAFGIRIRASVVVVRNGDTSKLSIGEHSHSHSP